MLKILILSMSTGGGHNEAARNLKNAFVDKGCEVKIVDAMSSVNKKVDTIINDAYYRLANKIPYAYGAIYKTANTQNVSKLILKSIGIVTKKRLLNLINEEKPDLIVSTHPFLVSPISEMKSLGEIDIPFMAVVTDFEAHRIYLSKIVDAYIVASPGTKEKMVEQGINGDIIYPYGIPVDPKFSKKTDIVKDDSVFNVLLMGGLLGFSFMEELVEDLLNIDSPIKVRVVCGKNKDVKNSIEQKHGRFIEDGILEVHGFVTNVDELMDMSDCIVTKPGGLTTTEAISKRIPMIIPFYVPGQEKENTDYLTYNDMAVVAKSKNEIKMAVEKFINKPKSLSYIKSNMADLSKLYSIDGIMEVAENLIEKRLKSGK